MNDPRALSMVHRILKARTGVDASLLPGSLEDAVSRRLEDTGLPSEMWLARLADDDGAGDQEAAEILDLLGIGHTHLFRHMAVWDVLAQELAGQGLERVVEVLLLGVSTGEEAYTALMQLGTRLGLENVSALGVDINPGAIARAIRGEYNARSAEHVPAWALDRYLDPTGAGFLVREVVRRRARFLTGSLFTVPRGGRYDLVLMRHVLIYFNEAERRRALDRAAELCRPGGLLVLGASEAGELTGDERFESVEEGQPVFRKRSLRRAVPPPSPAATPPPPGVLDIRMVNALIGPLLRGESREVSLDLTDVSACVADAAWALGRGLRLLALRGTVVTVLAPAAGEPRTALERSLVGELSRDGIIRWEEA